MGILNVTPDSFSTADASREKSNGRSRLPWRWWRTAPGSSTWAANPRGRAPSLSGQRRSNDGLPVIAALRARSDVAISIDTYRAETASLAVEAGASIVNDVWGAQREPDIARVAARSGAGLCLMHTGRERRKLRM